MNSVPLLRFLLSSLPFLRGLAWVAEGGGVGCRWVGRRLGPRLLQDRQERACSAELQAQSSAAAAERPEPRVQPPGVSARGAQRRASAPPRAHAPTQRRGDPGGGRGRACPSEGKGPVLPAQAAAAAAQEAEAAAAAEAATCPLQSPRRVGPAPASRPVRRHRAGAPSPLRSVSTSRGGHPWPPAGLRRAETHADPCAVRLSPALTRRGPPQLSGRSGGSRAGSTHPGLPGRLRHEGRGDSLQLFFREKPVPGSGPQFPRTLGVGWGGNDPEVCTPARGTSAWHSGGIDAAGLTTFGSF